MGNNTDIVVVDEGELNRRLIRLGKAIPHPTITNYHPIAQAELARLTDYIIGAEPGELYRLNPHYLAHKLGYSPFSTLELLVRMVQVGIFTLNWEVRCPSCKQVVGGYEHLIEVDSEGSCPHCGPFTNRLDYDICISFTINPLIRILPESTAEDSSLLLEQVYSKYGAVSGSDLLSIQFFRDFFEGEAVPINQSLKVQRMSFVFTDLSSSTLLYARRGDPRAFKLVSDHYSILFEGVNRHHGAVVKTVGDAVMATFNHPFNALAAAANFQRDLAAFNQRSNLSVEDALMLKVGIHTGSCLAVNLNNRLDYFGTTVNIASRIEALASGGQLLVSQAAMAESAGEEAGDVLKRVGCREVRNFMAELRGVSEALSLHELEVLPA